MSPVDLLPGAVSEIIATTTATQRLTQADRYGLMAAILNDSLDEQDRFCVDRLLRALCRGRIEIVDDLSIIL